MVEPVQAKKQPVDTRREITLNGSPDRQIRPGLVLRNANIGEQLVFGGFLPKTDEGEKRKEGKADGAETSGSSGQK